MQLSSEYGGRETEIADLFRSSFCDSEGPEEGALIGQLAADLMRAAQGDGSWVVTASVEGELIGAIIFTRLAYREDERTVYLLAPVAVAIAEQGKGVGQKLISHGLDLLREAGADVAITYGDPAYYSKTGFVQISEEFAQPPYRLKQPEGWQGLSLQGGELAPLKGPSHCVEAFHDPHLW